MTTDLIDRLLLAASKDEHLVEQLARRTFLVGEERLELRMGVALVQLGAEALDAEDQLEGAPILAEEARQVDLQVLIDAGVLGEVGRGLPDFVNLRGRPFRIDHDRNGEGSDGGEDEG